LIPIDPKTAWTRPYAVYIGEDFDRVSRRAIVGTANFSPSVDSVGDENGIIVPVKWCELVSLSIKA